MAGYKKSPNAKPIISITLEDDLLDKVVDFFKVLKSGIIHRL